MKKNIKYILLLSFMISFLSNSALAEKKVLYVASYHTEKGEWTAGIKAGIDSVLKYRSDIILKTFNMDTRLSRNESEKINAALKAKELIDSWKPDIVITSDDNAAKYLIVPYFLNKSLPFVFCGINWDAKVYGFPAKNVTGMIEIQLIGQIVKHLNEFTKGRKVGMIRGDTLSNHKEHEYFEKELKRKIEVRFVKNLKMWKKEFINLQKKVDMIVFGSLRALDTEGKSIEDIKEFVLKNTIIPTASYDAFMGGISLISLSTIPEEQGINAAVTALNILNGTPPESIPVEKNRKGKLYLNMKIAHKLKIKFPYELIERSHLISLLNLKNIYAGYIEAVKSQDLVYLKNK